MHSSLSEKIEQVQAEINRIMARKNQIIKDGFYEEAADARDKEKELRKQLEKLKEEANKSTFE